MYEFGSPTVGKRFSNGYIIDNVTGCWNWCKAISNNGYGKIGVSSYKTMTTHRVSWLIKYGEIKDNLFVLHKCDNRKCVNPDHLYLGTVKDNSRDLMERGNPYLEIRKHLTPEIEKRRLAALPRGKEHHRSAAKLTEEQVMEIFHSDDPQKEIAKRFGIIQQTVSLIKRKERWAYLHG